MKIGLVAPFEGRYRYVGYDVIHAVRLALREANAAGGVGGYFVELVAHDDGANPAMAVEQARKLAVDPNVVAAVGHFGRETTAAAVRAYAEAGIPLLAPMAHDPGPGWESGRGERGEIAYRIGPDADVLGAALLDDVSDADEVILVSDGGPLGQALQEAARGRRMHLVNVPLDAGGWRAEVLAQDPSTLICDADPVVAGEVVSALGDAGWKGCVMGGPALAASDFVAVGGEAAEGTVFVTPWPFPTDVPGGEAFAAAYRKVSGGIEPGPLALPAYEATWTLLEALAQSAAEGDPTRKSVSAAISTAERDGLLGHVSFDGDRAWRDAPLYRYRIGPDGVPEQLP